MRKQIQLMIHSENRTELITKTFNPTVCVVSPFHSFFFLLSITVHISKFRVFLHLKFYLFLNHVSPPLIIPRTLPPPQFLLILEFGVVFVVDYLVDTLHYSSLCNLMTNSRGTFDSGSFLEKPRLHLEDLP